MPTNPTADKVVALRDRLKRDRYTFEDHWQQIAERVWPNMADFNMTRTPGEMKNQKMYDGTAALAAQRFAAIIESMLTPRSQRWHRIKASNYDLMQDRDVALWFEEVTRIVFAMRYSPEANFASQQSEVYMGTGVFGTAALYIGSRSARNPLFYKSVPLAEFFCDEDINGVVNEVVRVMSKKLMNIAQEFGTENFTDDMKKCLEKEPNKMFTVLHYVGPNKEYNPLRMDKVGKKFSSIYVLEEQKIVLREGGFNTFPYAVSRYTTAANEIYGRSPAMLALPNIKMLGEMVKTTIKNAQRIADPSLLLYEDGALTEVNTTPGALNFGGLDNNGNELVKPLQTGADLGVSLEMMQDQRKFINDVFLVTLFQILVENPQMTATEVLEKAQEKGALLSPTIGRLQSEALGPMIVREVDILAEAGLLPPMPQALIDAQGQYDIEYDSPLTRAQQAEEVSGIVRTFQIISPYAQVNPSVWDNFDGDEIVRIAASAQGAPVRALLAKKDVEAIRQAKNEQMQQQEGIQGGVAVSQALKNVAQAQAAGK